jgi:energy-coupling factor transporter transmembrane protein EcfT
MAAPNKPHRNPPLWLALLFAVTAVLCNFVFFLNPPAQKTIPWLSLALAITALAFLAIGAKNVFSQPRTITAKILGSLVVLIALLFSAGSIFGFFQARAVPASTGAPQIGQKVPSFTLPDTNNRPISLNELLAARPTDSSPTAPKAVLLIFYRGYW